MLIGLCNVDSWTRCLPLRMGMLRNVDFCDFVDVDLQLNQAMLEILGWEIDVL